MIKLINVAIICWELTCGMIGVIFKLNKYRKTNYLIGHTIVGFNWLAMAISYHFHNFTFPIIAGFILATCCGTTFIVTYYTLVSEVCQAALIPISIGFYLMMNFMLLLIGPYMLTGPDKYMYWCIMNALWS